MSKGNMQWVDVQAVKKELVRQEQELLDITEGERDPSNTTDIHILEKARQAVSEALVQVGLFEESKTGHTWRKL